MDGEDPRKIISSALISSPKGVTLFALHKDYRFFTGQDIPFKQLGYETVEQYLHSIPEICRVSGSGRDTVIIPVVNENNKHINDLILKQRAPKNNPRCRTRQISRPRGIYDTSSNYSSKPQIQRPEPLDNFKLPVTNPNSHLRTVPPPPDYFLDMRRERNKPKNRRTSTDYRNQQQTYSRTVPAFQFETHSRTVPANQFEIHSRTVPTNQFQTQPPTVSTTQPRTVPATQSQTITTNRFETQRNMVSTPQTNNQYLEPCTSKSNYEPSASCSTTLASDKIQMIKNYSQSVHKDIAAALSEESDYDEYFNELSYDENEDDFYYKSDSDSIDLSTSTANLQVPLIVRQEEAIPMLDPKDHARENHVSSVNDNVKEKLRQLISEHPDGIWCSKLLKIYCERFKQKLDPLNFGFPSVIQLCDDIPDVFHCIRPNRMDWKLYDSRNPVPDVHSMRDLSKYLQSLVIKEGSNCTEEPALPKNNLLNFNPSYKYPDTVLNPNETIERLKLPDDSKLDKYIEIVVSEVYDPSKFWIQKKGEHTFNALEKLMDEMQIFYMHNAGTLQLNEFSVRIGLFVAALFMNEFHRAVVIKVFDDQTLKVFYIDYGTVAEVQLRKTCLLHRDFSSLPQQAVRSRLDNIVPVNQNTMWPREAAQFMLNMVMEKTLFALIRHIDREQQILHLILTDTSQELDIHINDELVNSAYAVLGNEAPLCPTSSAIVPNVHLYPSFEEIENYIYPSVGDVIGLLKLGHTYETIFHGYFSHSCNYSPECSHSSNGITRLNSVSNESFSQDNNRSYFEDQSNLESQYYFEEQTNVDQNNCEYNHHESFENKMEELEEFNSDEYVIPDGCREEISNEELNKKIFNPPPGFEKVQPDINNFSPNTNTVDESSTIQENSALSLLGNFPIEIQNIPPLNTLASLNHWINEPVNLNLALLNPVVLQQILLKREILLNQQREAILNRQRDALFQHQFEEFQRILSISPGLNRYPNLKNMYDDFIRLNKSETNNVFEFRK